RPLLGRNRRMGATQPVVAGWDEFGRADLLKRRRKARDEILGRVLILPLPQGEGWGEGTQSPSRKGRRQTLNGCLVQPPLAVAASFKKYSLQPLAERQATTQDETDPTQSAFGVRPLDFRDHVEVRHGSPPPRPALSARPHHSVSRHAGGPAGG